jgi:hypothetical protein
MMGWLVDILDNLPFSTLQAKWFAETMKFCKTVPNQPTTYCHYSKVRTAAIA